MVTFVCDIFDMANWKCVYALKCFIMEIHKKSFDIYPSETLYQVVVCLPMYLNSHGINDKFLNEDSTIQKDCYCLDNRIKELSRAGNVAQHKKADVIMIADENLNWVCNVLGSSNPTQLVNTILYMFDVFSLSPTLHPGALISIFLSRIQSFLFNKGSAPWPCVKVDCLSCMINN